MRRSSWPDNHDTRPFAVSRRGPFSQKRRGMEPSPVGKVAGRSKRTALAFPFGEGVARRRRMRSIPCGLARPAVSGRDAGHPARKLACLCGDAGLPPGPAQGLTPPLHPRKGFHPLTLFRWRDPRELRELAVSIAGCGASRPETRVFLFLFPAFFCCSWAAAQTCAGANAAPAPAQGASPLDPFPLARFRGVGRICTP